MRLLSREVRALPAVREDPELLRVIDAAVAEGRPDRLSRLDPRRKRLLLEALDERASQRSVPEPAALVRVTELLLPLALSPPSLTQYPSGPAR